MKALTFSIHTEQPVLATSFQGDPNSDVSYSYIPGSMIRGAIIGRYLKQSNLGQGDILENSTVRRLFFDDSTRYLNAYLLTQDSHQPRSLPIPKSWRKHKHDDLSHEKRLTVYDLSRASIDDDDVTPKSLGDSFCAVNRSDVTLYSEQRRINIHNQRDRRKGRATEQSGQVFRYEAIDADQTFQAVILFDQDDDEQIIKDLLPGNSVFWLGGSQSAGYGRSHISDVTPHTDWCEAGDSVEDRCDRSQLTITLLSDLILRDPQSGQYIVEPPTQIIADALGLDVDALKLTKSYMSSSLTGGFNRKWGLPLPQIQAIAAGSIFVFDKLSLKPQKIQEAELQGIGERCNEGFGRFVVNWLGKKEFSAGRYHNDQPESQDELNLQDEVAKKIAQQMAERILRCKLDEWLIRETDRCEIENCISNSQLSRLILVSRRAINQEQPSRDLMLQLLDNLPGNAKRQFERATISGGSLNQKIRNWLEQPLEQIDVTSIDVAGQPSTLSQTLATEYVLRLIMAVAKKASKEENHDSRIA